VKARSSAYLLSQRWAGLVSPESSEVQKLTGPNDSREHTRARDQNLGPNGLYFTQHTQVDLLKRHIYTYTNRSCPYFSHRTRVNFLKRHTYISLRTATLLLTVSHAVTTYQDASSYPTTLLPPTGSTGYHDQSSVANR
jgi:hypothetical protein